MSMLPTYTVQPGDTLSKVSEKLFGDQSMWQYLASINSISSPYTIYPGQQLNYEAAGVESSKTKKKKKSILPYVIGGVVLAATGYYFRDDITNFFKRVF